MAWGTTMEIIWENSLVGWTSDEIYCRERRCRESIFGSHVVLGSNHSLYNAPLTYSYLIGKKQNYRFGRLGFSADEYARLAYGRQSGVGFKILKECQRLMKDME